MIAVVGLTLDYIKKLLPHKKISTQFQHQTSLVHFPFRPEELRPESQLVLLAKLAANQPEPIWPLILQLTLR